MSNQNQNLDFLDTKPQHVISLGSVFQSLDAMQTAQHVPVNRVTTYMPFEKGDSVKGMLEKIEIETREVDGVVTSGKFAYWFQLSQDGKKIESKCCAMNHFVRALEKNFVAGDAFHAICIGDVKNKTNAFKSRAFEIYGYK
jgi:hypothetical protein